MRRIPRIAFGAAALMLCAAAAFAQASGDPAAGRRLYETKGCYSCHGYVGQGSREGPRLVPALPLANFVPLLRTPRTIMPPYTQAVLSDQEAANIHAFLESLPAPPDPATIPLLR